jgi:glycosyltransferase involved in cell wall biosynthesis
MDNIKISVILPVYNPGAGISKCIASLRNQTLRDIELIFVDDLGDDGSMDRVREAAAEDSRIRVITNPRNMGPGFSRNAGIEASRGEYLSFIDPDDYVADDFYELLYEKAAVGKNDIVKGRICYTLEDGTVIPRRNMNESIRNGLEKGRPLYAVFCYEHHSAIYKRELVMSSGARYGLARRAQDTTFLLKICHAAVSMETEDFAMYYFCERTGSTMHSSNVDALDYLLFSFREQVDYICGHLGGDPWAESYTTNILLTNLRFYMRYKDVPENGPALRAFAEGTAAQLLRLPFYGNLSSRCLPARVLVDKGTVLPASPGHLPWESADLNQWLGLFKLWMDFLSANPSYCHVSRAPGWIYRLWVSTENAGAKEGRQAAAREKLKELAGTLDMRTRLILRFRLALGRASVFAPGWLHHLRGLIR